MKKITALLVAALLAMLSLAGCAGFGGSSAGASEKNLTGSYYALYDMSEAMQEGLGEMGISFSDPVEVAFLLDLNEDKTFTFAMDTASFISSVTDALQSSMDSIIAGIMGQEELDEETASALAKEAGYDTYEDFRQYMTEMIAEQLQNQGLEELKMEGTYTVEGDKISFTPADEENKLDDAVIESDGSLTIAMDNEVVSEGSLHFEKGTYTAKEAA